MKNYLFLLITIILVLSSFIFSLKLLPSQITFGFDQARDAYEAYSIWNGHHFKILGPSSDVPGLNHGVLWYYFLAIVYGFSQGSPEGAAFLSLALLYLFIPVIGIIVYKITKNYQYSLLTVILYSFAPLFIAFSHWLSNPTLALFIAPLLLLSIWMYLHKQSRITVFFIGMCFGLLIQTDFAFIVLLLTVPLYLYVFKLKVTKRNSILFLFGFIIAISTFILSYIKFHTNILQIILLFLVNNTGSDLSTSNALLTLLDSVINIFAITILPFPKLLLFFSLVAIFLGYRRSLFISHDKLVSFLLIWMSGIIFLFAFNHGSASPAFFYAPFIFPIVFLCTLIISRLIKSNFKKIIIISIIMLLQIVLVISWSNKFFTPLSIQQGNTIKFERNIVDYTYTSADRKPFIINTVTDPLFINTTWAYLYEYYGQNNYHYLPFFAGKDQAGYLGNLQQNPPANITLRFLIIEPREGIPTGWITKIIFDEDKMSDVVEEKQFGNFLVQKRIYHPNKINVATPAAILANPSSYGE